MTPDSPLETIDLADLLERARDRLRRNHRVRSGTSVALNYSQEIDRLLQAHARSVAASDSRFAGVEHRLAVVAVGGYGRRELNLHSDIDLLFVLPGEPQAEDEHFIKQFLYPLWSLRIDLGYSVKPLDLVLKEIGEDLDLTTSLFTMHRIWGDEKLFTRLRENLRLQVTLHYEESLSIAIVERLRSRHLRYSDTCQLLEPHLKDSPGGLRDIHVLQWLGFVNFGGEGLHSLTGHGLLSPGDERELRQALAFLMELRNGLHIMEGRKTDHLNIERQIRIAPLIGIEARENALPEEQLMRAYYQRVTQVDRIVRRVVRQFESQRMTPKVTGKSRLRARRMEGLFRLRDNQLGIDPKEAATATGDSHWMMHLFSVASLYDFSIDDFTLDLVAGKLADVDEGFRRSAANRDRFLGILGNRRSAARTLRLMHACGFLDAYIP
ncbi:MAG: hypothetical protein KF858_09210, partial [Candidatus Sumerlaeia bacterium]|nr:hypothetical protein [Candidatus Sumerlaeia bacterium]